MSIWQRIANFMRLVASLPPQRLPISPPPLSSWREAVETPSISLRCDGLEAGDEETIAACVEDAYPSPNTILTENNDAAN